TIETDVPRVGDVVDGVDELQAVNARRRMARAMRRIILTTSCVTARKSAARPAAAIPPQAMPRRSHTSSRGMSYGLGSAAFEAGKRITAAQVVFSSFCWFAVCWFPP